MWSWPWRLTHCIGLQGMLKEHQLPRLAKLDNGALWLHFVEEAVSFERSLAPLRGLLMPMASPELPEITAEPWNEGSCLELLATQPVRPGVDAQRMLFAPLATSYQETLTRPPRSSLSPL
jgi:hypothetical protein